jgi:UDP-glucose 4-epimerase
MGVRVEPEYGPERKVNPVPRRLASTDKAKQMLGFTASVTLDEGLSRLVKWWRAERVRA